MTESAEEEGKCVEWDEAAEGPEQYAARGGSVAVYIHHDGPADHLAEGPAGAEALHREAID